MTSKSRCTVYFLTYVATLSACRHLDSEYQSFSFRICQLSPRPGLLEAWLVLTSVKYHGNLYILIPLSQRLALTRLRATGPWSPALRTTVAAASRGPFPFQKEIQQHGEKKRLGNKYRF